MRRTLLAAATVCAVLAFVSCSDDAAGPRAPLAGQLAIVPSFGTLQGGIVEIARGRFVLTRIPGGEVAKDTVIEIAADADSVDLSLDVLVLTAGETFNLTISLISPAGDTVFGAGPLEVTPSTSGTPTPIEAPFTYVGPGADAAGVRMVSPDTSTFTGEIVLLLAEAFGGDAVAIPGTPIGWESLDTARVAVTTDGLYRGLAVGGSQRGVARLVATLVTGQKDTVLVSNQPLPTTLVAESGSGQSARADSVLASPLVARVTAGDGLGVTGLWVRFAETSGGGSVSPESVLTDATGRAAVQYTMARSLTPHVVTASTARLGTATAVFNATLVFEPPATIEIVAGDGQTAVAGLAVATAPQVRVLDADGLSVPGVTVTFSVTAGGGIVAGGTPVTDDGGLAAISGWTLGTAAGSNALQATGGGLPPVTFTATGVAGPATQLALASGNGQTDTVAQAAPLPLVVRATDANGNAVGGATVDWSATSGSVTPPSSVTDGSGLAQAVWTFGATAGAYSATATLEGTAASVGFTGSAVAAAAFRLRFTMEPATTVQGAVITPPVVVTAFDPFDNVAVGFTGPVQLAILANPGGGTLLGTASTAAVAGVATFADLRITAPGTGYTLAAQDTGVEPDTSSAFDITAAGNISWIAAAGGNWSDGANWNIGAPPGLTDTAQIVLDGTYTVTLDQDVTVGRLVVGGVSGAQTLAQGANTLTVIGTAALGANAQYLMNGGSIGGGTFTSAGTVTWTGGALTGATSFTNSGTLTLSGGAAKTLGSTATLSNTGTITHTGAGSLVLTVGAVVSNGPGALYDFQADAAIDWVSGTSPEPFVNNQGTIRKSGGTGQSFIDQLQNLGGTLDVQTGELELRSYDGTTNTSTGGVFTVATGATLDLTPESGAYDSARFQGAYSGSGGGTVLFDGGDLIVGSGTSFDFPAGMFQWQGGTITGGTFTNLDAMAWTAGNVASSASLLNDGTLGLSGSGSKILDGGAVLTNAGTIAHAGTGSLVLSVGSVINVQAGAIHDLQGDVSIDWVSGTSPEPFVNNQGTIRKTAGTGLSFIDQLANLGGTVEVQTGELELRHYDGTTNTSTGGVFTVAPGATLDLSPEFTAYDDSRFRGTYTGSGGGTVLLDNGVLDVGTGATFTFPGAMLQWQGGTIAGGALTNAGTLTASGAAAKTLAAGATLTNQGTLAVEAGTFAVAGTFNHASGAVLQGTGILDLSAATVSGFSGVVNPGTSPGLLTVVGPIALGAGAVVNVEWGGTNPGTDVDQLRFAGGASTLGGTLNVTLLGPYLPVGGERVPIVVGKAGTFGTVNLPAAGPLTLSTETGTDTLYLVASTGGAGVNTWITTAGGSWSDGANWTLGRAPIAGDTVVINVAGTYTVDMDVTTSVDSLAVGGASGTQTLLIQERTLTVVDGATFAATGRLQLASGALAGTVSTSGPITVNGLSTVTGALSTGATSVTLLQAENSLTNAVLSVGGGFTNGGTLDLQNASSAFSWSVTLNVSGGSLLNQGTIRSMASAGGGDKTINATVVNQGTIATPGNSLTLTGAFTHAAGAVIEGSQPLDLSGATILAFDGEIRPGTSPGLLQIVAPAGLTLGAGAIVQAELGGTTTAGTDYDQLRVTNQPLTLGGTLDVTLINAFVPNGTETWPLLTGVTGAFTTVNLPPLDLPWTIYLQNDTLFLGPPPPAPPGINTWIPAGGVWSDDTRWSLGRAPIPGDTVLLTSSLDYQVTLDVDATIAKLTIGGTGDVISLDVGDQTLTITDVSANPGLDILPLGSIPINDGTISVNRLANAGSLRSTGTASVVASVIANSNNWRVATGTLTVSHPTSAEFQQTAGSIAVEPGATLTLGANSYLSYQGGTIVEAGAVSFSSGTSLSLYADLGIDGPQLVLNDAAVVAVDADRLTIGPTSTFSLISASTIAESNAKIVNQGSIYASGPGSFFNDSLYNEAGAVVEVDGVGAGSLVGTVGVDNSGTIELGGTAEARFGPGSSTGRFITNRASGSILLQPGAPRFLNGELVNQGTVTVNALTELARRTPQNAHVAAQHVNSGTINVLGGDLTVVMGGTSPTFTNQGTITVATPRSLIVSNASNATFTNAATGIIEGTGTVNVTGGSPTVTNLGTIAPGLSPGVLTWAGNLPLGASSVLDVELGGTSLGTEYDQLDASGFQITRSGIMNVTLIDGFQPADGDQFVIMQGLHTGQFTAVNLPTVPGVTLDTSSTLTTFVVTVTAALPPSPPGTETVWLGTADGDWTNPANWFDGNVPDDTMNTFIPAGTPFAPVIGIGADLDVDTLVVEDGASLGVDGALSVYGDLAAGTTSISGSGSLTLAGVSGTVSGTVPALTVAGNYTVTGDLTVNGDLLLEGNDSTAPEVPGTNLRINGNDVLVTGDFTTARFGRLHMLSAADTLEVQGNATFNGDETVNALTAGVLLVAGNFTQQGSIRSASFHPTGGHKTVLNGSATQTVSFENTALRLSTFGGLEITNAVGVTFATPITALGTITVTAPIAISMLQRLEADGGLTLDPGASLTTPYLQFGGTLDLEPANFTVDTVAVSNGSLPGGLPYVTVYVVGAGGELLGSTIVNDDLHVQADLNVNGQTLVVAGNLVVSGGSLARLVMASPDDSVVVEGDATFNGAAYPGVPGTGLEAGVLEVQGNFTQTGTVGPFPAGGNNFVASGNHITHFTGPNPEISFSHPDSSWFHHVIFATEESPVDLLTDASATGDLTLPPGFQGVDAPGFAMTVLGAVTAQSEMTLAGLGVFGTLNADPALYAVETTIFGGPVAQTIPDSLPYQNVSVVAEAAFMGNTDVTGVLAVGGDPLANPVVLSVGPYAVNAFQLVVTGSGIVRMTDPSGELDIAGNALFDGFSTVEELTAGLLQVAGDFSQMSTNDLASFAASGTHVTELTGNGPQNIFFASPDTAQSHFGHLLVDNSTGVSFLSDAAVYGQLISPTPANGVERTLSGAGTLVVRGLDADSLLFDGLALAVGEGAAISRFDAARFENQDPGATQLFLRRKADDVTFDGLAFATTPTTGQYLHLVDEDGIVPAFTVTMTSTTPPSHGGFILLEQGAQLLGWPAEPPSQVLFSSSGGVPVGLFSVDADGANLFNLSASEGTSGFANPRWAPDHARVTYTFAPAANNLLKVAAADASAFASVVTDVSAYRPRYGLNGVRLAFECSIGGIPEVCVVPDVSGPIALLNGAGDGDGRNVVSDAAETIDAVFTSGPAAFAWNPSFLDEIAFFRDTIDAVSGAAVSHLFRASFDGSTVNLYTPDGMDDGQGPLKVVGTIDWSVDGLIAFTAYAAGQSPFNTDLYVIQADGTGLKRLTAMSAVVGPVFSPGGSEILFAYTGDGAKIYRISSTGQPNDEVPIHFGYFNWFPLEDLGWDWSPDGTEIVLADPTYSDGELVIVKVKNTTTDATYTDDRVLIGRTGGAAAVIDRQPSWRP